MGCLCWKAVCCFEATLSACLFINPQPFSGLHAAAGQGINLEDAWARLYLARACAYVVHSDQSSGDVSRDGAPFWQMLYLLATRCVCAEVGLAGCTCCACWRRSRSVAGGRGGRGPVEGLCPRGATGCSAGHCWPGVGQPACNLSRSGCKPSMQL